MLLIIGQIVDIEIEEQPQESGDVLLTFWDIHDPLNKFQTVRTSQEDPASVIEAYVNRRRSEHRDWPGKGSNITSRTER